MKTPRSPSADSNTRLFRVAAIIGVTVLLGGSVVLLLNPRKPRSGPQSSAVAGGEPVLQSTNHLPVTPGAEPAPPAPGAFSDFSTSNVVSTLLGEEDMDLGLAHLPNQSDGRTTLENLDGMPCRHLNLKPENKGFGYVYFVIHPSFKSRELTNARIELEYFSATPRLAPC